MGAAAGGASWTGAALDGRFGARRLLGGGLRRRRCAALRRGGRGAAAAGGRGGFGAAPSGGSGVMMLTGGVEAAVGNSALVGLPVGTDGGSAAIMPGGSAGGAFQDAA